MKKSDPGEGKAQKKDKKEKKEKKEGAAEAGEGKKKVAGGGKAAPAEDAGEPVPSMIDLRVGHIVDGMCSAFYFITPSDTLFSQKTSGCRWFICRGNVSEQ